VLRDRLIVRSVQVIDVPPRSAEAVTVTRGDPVRVVNTDGGQVVDLWAVVPPAGDEFLSMEHSRAVLRTTRVRRGLTFVSNLRRPLLALAEDTSPGVHDMLMPPCDAERYAELGALGHPNCKDNLHAALDAVGLRLPCTPGPLNLFQNSPVDGDGAIEFLPSLARPGDAVTVVPTRDLVLVLSACPMDIMPINHGRPVGVRVEVGRAAAVRD
jgi:uncharacterized protein YcgI (DUF1989 family)